MLFFNISNVLLIHTLLFNFSPQRHCMCIVNLRGWPTLVINLRLKIHVLLLTTHVVAYHTSISLLWPKNTGINKVLNLIWQGVIDNNNMFTICNMWVVSGGGVGCVCFKVPRRRRLFLHRKCLRVVEGVRSLRRSRPFETRGLYRVSKGRLRRRLGVCGPYGPSQFSVLIFGLNLRLHNNIYCRTSNSFTTKFT